MSSIFSGPFVIGVDVGTQSAKVMLFDSNGLLVCSGQEALQALEIPQPSYAEHPDDDIWDSLKTAFKACMRAFSQQGHSAVEIAAIGLCVIRCCRALLRKNGDLAGPLINWMDKRLNQPYQHEPEYGDVVWVTTSSGYITQRLTGEFKDTCANYIGWWPMDDQTLNWSTDRNLWQQCNLERDQVFDVVQPGEVLGLLREGIAAELMLPAGIPVVATAHDKAVEALGAGALQPGTLLVSLGTYIGVIVHGDRYRDDCKHFWSFQASIPGQYLYECMGVRRGMWAVSWFRDQFGAAVAAQMADTAEAAGLSIEDMLNREAQQVPAGSEGLITVHDWAAPPEAEFRKGAIIGFDGRHTRAHMYRSLLEGLAFRLRSTAMLMAAELEQPIERIVVSGGGANSDLFMQIIADVFGVPASRNEITGSAATGSAINAGLSVGMFTSVQDALSKLLRVADSFEPIVAHHLLYSNLHESVYQYATDHLDPLHERLGPLVD